MLKYANLYISSLKYPQQITKLTPPEGCETWATVYSRHQKSLTISRNNYEYTALSKVILRPSVGVWPRTAITRPAV